MTDVLNMIASYPKPLAARLEAIRKLIHKIAAHDRAVGAIQESLKWGQPSFATVGPKSGTPIRIDGNVDRNTYSIFVPCSTSLIEDFRTNHPDMFNYHGNREIRLDLNTPMPEKKLALFLAAALRYYVK